MADPSEESRERTLLAQERTFSAWIRTGLTAMAAGFAIARLSKDTRPGWLPVAVGVALALAGALVQAASYLKYLKTVRALRSEGVRELPRWLVGLLCTLIVTAALAVAVVLLTSPRGS